MSDQSDLKKSRMRLSLRSQVAVGMALPIFVTLTLLSVFHYVREFQLLNEQVRLHAAHLGELMIQSLNHAMLTKEGAHLSSSIADVSQLESIEKIQVIGLSGIVLASSSGEAETRVFNLQDEECQSCHQFPVGEMPRAIAYPQLQEGLLCSL